MNNDIIATIVSIATGIFVVAIFVFLIIGIVQDEYEKFLNKHNNQEE